jgi:hypothetical protein
VGRSSVLRNSRRPSFSEGSWKLNLANFVHSYKNTPGPLYGKGLLVQSWLNTTSTSNFQLPAVLIVPVDLRYGSIFRSFPRFLFYFQPSPVPLAYYLVSIQEVQKQMKQGGKGVADCGLIFLNMACVCVVSRALHHPPSPSSLSHEFDCMHLCVCVCVCVCVCLCV